MTGCHCIALERHTTAIIWSNFLLHNCFGLSNEFSDSTKDPWSLKSLYYMHLFKIGLKVLLLTNLILFSDGHTFSSRIKSHCHNLFWSCLSSCSRSLMVSWDANLQTYNAMKKYLPYMSILNYSLFNSKMETMVFTAALMFDCFPRSYTLISSIQWRLSQKSCPMWEE